MVLIDHQNTIGSRIRYYRNIQKLTQKQLAESAGINEVTLRCYEAGKYRPRYDKVCSLCKVLGLRPEDILEPPTSKSGDPGSDAASCIQEDTTYSPGPGLSSSLSNLSSRTQDLSFPAYGENQELIDEALRHLLALNRDGLLKALEQLELLGRIPEFREKGEKD